LKTISEYHAILDRSHRRSPMESKTEWGDLMKKIITNTYHILAFLGALISFPLIMLLVVMFYTAVTTGGSLTIHINNYSEQGIEMYVIIPLVVVTTFLNAVYTMKHVDKELKDRTK